MIRAAFEKKHNNRKLTADANRCDPCSPLGQIRKAVFAATAVREGGVSHKKKRPLLQAYVDHTAAAAANGSLAAINQSFWLAKIAAHKKLAQGSEADEAEIAATRQDLARRMAFSELTSTTAASIYFLILPDIELAYRNVSPKIANATVRVPYEWQTEFAQLGPRFKRNSMRRAAAARRLADGEPEVGYRKPPVSTRWKSGCSGNPSGKKQATDDVWASVQKAAMKTISFKAEGRRVKSTAIATAVRQLFFAAMRGERGAHQQVKRLLIMLDKLNLLSPPPKEPRRSRRRTSAQKAAAAAMQKKIWRILLPKVKARTLEEFERVHGAIPPFETRLERFLADEASAPSPRAPVRMRTHAPSGERIGPTEQSPELLSLPRPRIRSRARKSGDV